jgi:hypothetical protein
MQQAFAQARDGAMKAEALKVEAGGIADRANVLGN